MVNDSNVTTFCVQQQIHETGKHPISVSWLSTEKKKGLEHEYEPNLYKTYNPNTTTVNFPLYTALLLYFTLTYNG